MSGRCVPVLLNALHGSRCLRDDRHVGLTLNHCDDPFPKKRMVIHGENSNDARIGHSGLRIGFLAASSGLLRLRGHFSQ